MLSAVSLLFIYYATKAAQENTSIQIKTRKIIHNKTTIKLQICSQRCRKRVCS